MKLLNILGAVIAVHIAVLVLAVAIPGCRSTDQSAAVVASDDTTYAAAEPASSGISSAPELTNRDLNPPVAGSGPAAFDPDATAVGPSMSESYAGGGSRYSPTRPGTTVATAMQTALTPVEVTPAVTYTVQRGDNLWSLARKHHLSVRELAAANHLDASVGLKIGQVLVIPGQAPASVVAAAAAEAAAQPTYEVKAGDTLGAIAKRNHSTVAELKALNNLRSDTVRVGDHLVLPGIPAAAGLGSTPEPSTATAVTTSAPTASPEGNYKHVVSPGESLTLIAKRYGVKLGDLALANKIRDPSLIRPGQELIIPGVKASAAAAAVAKANAPTNAISAQTANRASATPPAGDLDAGLSDTSLDNVPVIPVESAPASLDGEPPITTIDIGGGDSSQPPHFN